jgi:UDP-N-acetylglucosamine acyltransferase
MIVHETALVAKTAMIASNVQIGPYCVVGEGVSIGAGTILHGHVVIGAHAVLGEGNEVFPFCTLGMAPQSRRLPHATAAVRIGARNTFREQVTVHGGTLAPTLIGDDNLLMVGSHVAHDVQLGSFTTLANGVQLAGHVCVADYATFGGLSGVAQHVRVGESAFVAAGAMCERDVAPYVIVQGDRARVRGINRVGLKRRGFSDVQIDDLQRALRAYQQTPENRKGNSLAEHLKETLARVASASSG